MILKTQMNIKGTRYFHKLKITEFICYFFNTNIYEKSSQMTFIMYAEWEWSYIFKIKHVVRLKSNRRNKYRQEL